MAYQMPLREEDEINLNRDYAYMKSLYPDMAKRVLPYVEDECDRLEYAGSMMYDEYPDPLTLRLACRRVYDQVKNEEQKDLLELITIMMYQEMCQRRHEYRMNKRKLYQIPRI